MFAASSSQILPGLVSVTFRQLSCEDVIALCVRHGLRGIEWGGDVHCPLGNLDRARDVARLTFEAGLETVAYGSYFRASETAPEEFSRALEIAVALRAPVIRVWAGYRASAGIDPEYRARVIEELIRVTTLARAAGVRVSVEYHSRTLMDEISSALGVLGKVPELSVHWQPANGQPEEEALADLARVLPRLGNLHVFSWRREETALVRLPFAEHRSRWQRYLATAAQVPGRRFALLEFVRDDDPAQLAADAQVLRELLAELG
jgi:3-dehydroshikimate dehydratase